MRVPRLYINQKLTSGSNLPVEGQPARHVTQVLRLRSGAPLRVFDGHGSEYLATLRDIRRGGVTIEVGEPATAMAEPALHITLAQGIARGDRMDLILQKAVELGVSRIQPLWMQRSQSRLKGERLEKRIHHWQGVIVNACEQCGRTTLPDLAPVTDFASWVTSTAATGLRLLLQPHASQALPDLQPPDKEVVFLVGPEGGMEEEEQDLAARAGFAGIRLGQRILRTETAALAALAGMQTLWGDFRTT